MSSLTLVEGADVKLSAPWLGSVDDEEREGWTGMFGLPYWNLECFLGMKVLTV